jgi:uncharacterized protein YbjT (DUF2867 family)
MTTDQAPILVLGATGKTGRRVADRLTAIGVPVRAGSRSATPAFDWEDPDTWADALDGVSAVYVSYYPDLAVPTAPDAVGALARLAADKGVQRLVLLSGRGEPEAQRAEQTMAAAGVPWTVLRCSWFAQNFDEGAFAESLSAGELALPVGDVPEPFVDVEDIADVAVAALTEDGHAGEVYELTGARMLTFAQAVAEIAQASEREIAFAPISVDDFVGAMSGYGVPPAELELLSFLFTEVLDGRNAHLTDGVQRALGREPRDFRDFAQRAAANGAWSA